MYFFYTNALFFKVLKGMVIAEITSQAADYKIKTQNIFTVGDGFMNVIQGMRFSTYDRDLDMSAPTHDFKAPDNCAVEQGGSGGWWFNQCSPVCLTGKYLRPGEYEYRNEIYWEPLTGNEESLEMVEMKIYEN